jgi:hypothetical protein
MSTTLRNIELLTTVKVLSEGGAVEMTHFGNIVELSCKALVLESSRECRVGDGLTISLVFPGVERGSSPISSLDCVVRRVRDGSNLQYDVAIKDMDDTVRQRLVQYLSKPRPERRT